MKRAKKNWFQIENIMFTLKWLSKEHRHRLTLRFLRATDGRDYSQRLQRSSFYASALIKKLASLKKLERRVPRVHFYEFNSLCWILCYTISPSSNFLGRIIRGVPFFGKWLERKRKTAILSVEFYSVEFQRFVQEKSNNWRNMKLKNFSQ